MPLFGRVCASKITCQSLWLQIVVVKTTIETTGNTDICLNFLIHYRGICSKAPCYCIVMEFCLQGALYDVLRHKDQSILPPQVVSWSRQIASGMQFLHSHRIIHRDLKSPKYVEFTYKTSDSFVSYKISLWFVQTADIAQLLLINK